MGKKGDSAWSKSRHRVEICLVFSVLCHASLLFFSQESAPVRSPRQQARTTVLLVDGPSGFSAEETSRKGETSPKGEAIPPRRATELAKFPPSPRPLSAAQPKPSPPEKEKMAAAVPPSPASARPSPSDTTLSMRETPPDISPTRTTEPAKESVSSAVPHPAAAGEGEPEECERAAGGGDSIPADPVIARFGTPEGPRVERMVQPKYPLRARRLRRGGNVLLRLHINRSGVVRSAEVIEAAGYGFDESAVEAVKQSRFRPATRNGRLVECLALLPVRFALRPR